MRNSQCQPYIGLGRKGHEHGPDQQLSGLTQGCRNNRSSETAKKLRDSQRIKEDERFGDKVTDLTSARHQILKVANEMANENTNVEFAFARDGMIHCKLRNQKFVQLENADDLYKIGVDNINYADFYGRLD